MLVQNILFFSQLLIKIEQVQAELKRCNMNAKNCNLQFNETIPNFCDVLGSKTTGVRFFQQIEPKLKCPLKKVTNYN